MNKNKLYLNIDGVNIYVSPDGNGDGKDISNPCNPSNMYDIANAKYSKFINFFLSDGEYTNFDLYPYHFNSKYIALYGNGENTIIGDLDNSSKYGISIYGGMTVAINNLKINNGVYIEKSCLYVNDDLWINNSRTTASIRANYNSLIKFTTNKNYSFNNLTTCEGCIFASGNSQLIITNSNIVANGTFSAGFAYSSWHGELIAYSNVFTGSITGRRYYVDSFGLIYTNNAGQYYFPGSEEGYCHSTGLYL